MYMYDLTKANKGFEEIKTIRSNIESGFNVIHTKLKSLQKIYSNVVSKHKKLDCTLGVDALFFQSELIKKEYNNLQDLYKFINNRIYCEYYKLYNYIKEYILKEMQCEIAEEIKVLDTFPPYKTLDTTITYDFGNVLKMQSNIINILDKLDKYVNESVVTNNNEKELLQMGLHIDTVIYTQDYMNSILKEKLKMFSFYLKTFNIHHKKHLGRLQTKTDMIVNIISDDMPLNNKQTEPASVENINDDELNKSNNVTDNKRDTTENNGAKVNNDVTENNDTTSNDPAVNNDVAENNDTNGAIDDENMEEDAKNINSHDLKNPTISISNDISKNIKFSTANNETNDNNEKNAEFAKNIVDSKNVNFTPLDS